MNAYEFGIYYSICCGFKDVDCLLICGSWCFVLGGGDGNRWLQ